MIISSATKTIIRRELKSYFLAPLGYVFLIIFLFAIGYVTFEPGRGSFFLMRQADLSSFFRYIPWLFMVLIPAISMRLLAEERKSGTIELILTMPVSVTELVLGKFFSSWAFILFALLCTFPMIVTVVYLGNPDMGVIFFGYLGAALLGGSFLATGTLFSSLTKNTVTSFILSVVFCYILTSASSPPILEFLSTFLPNYCVEVFESLSIITHFEAMQRGVLRLGDLWFYAVMIVGQLGATILLLDENKAS